MKIALVRHGQTEENFLERIQGRSNHKLNDTGIRECQKLRNKIQNEKFDYCYMSPLARCVETAMILVGDKVQMIPDERLIERNMGNLEGHPREEYNPYRYWDYDLNDASQGVEPVQDIFARCADFLIFLKENHSNEFVLIVTHGAPYRAIRLLATKHKLKGKLMDGFIDNCQYEVYEIQ